MASPSLWKASVCRSNSTVWRVRLHLRYTFSVGLSTVSAPAAEDLGASNTDSLNVGLADVDADEDEAAGGAPVRPNPMTALLELDAVPAWATEWPSTCSGMGSAVEIMPRSGMGRLLCVLGSFRSGGPISEWRRSSSS